MRIAVLGRTHWLIAVADQCLKEGHSIVVVATATAAPEYTAREHDFERLADRAGAQFHLNPDINGEDFVGRLAEAKAEIGVSINWPMLIRERTCRGLPYGILNAHAGDLPRYRGNACPNWAIINGEAHIGVCIHAMDPSSIDAGPVYARSRMALHAGTYIADVYRWLDEILPCLFREALKNAANPDFVPEDQATSGITPLRCHPRRPEDGLIDWDRPATAVARLVRASSRPFAGAFTYLEGVDKVTIWRARPVELAYETLAVPGQIMGRGPAGGILVACETGAIEVEEAEVSSGNPLPAANKYRLTRAARAGP